MNANTWTSCALAALLACFTTTAAAAADMPGIAPSPPVQDDGTIATPSFNLPFSSFASREAADELVNRIRNPTQISPDIAKMRKMTDDKMAPLLALAKSLYPYTSTKSVIGGVPVETFTPAAGISPKNKDRVLIELHGGGFLTGGGGPDGASEAVPLASVARIKVVAVDYRQAPEHRFPAGSEDVATVYRALLKTHRPENIGIYGCSAGGMLTAEAIPWFLKEHLPLPGAIGVFCASTHTFAEGDSAQLWPRMGSVIPLIPPAKPDGTFGRNSPYFAGASPKDPLAVPSASTAVLKAFPPTLFLTGTRAPEMSAAAQSHLELRDLGVTSELLLFDGMDHGFYVNPNLPESKRAYRLVAQFFDENLGHKKPPAK